MCISTLGYCPIDVYSSKPLLTKVRLNREKDITDLINKINHLLTTSATPRFPRSLRLTGIIIGIFKHLLNLVTFVVSAIKRVTITD